MRRASLLVVVLAVAGCGGTSRHAVSTVAPPTPPIPPPREQFGASVNLLFNGRNISDAVIASQLAALHATGATLARSDALWEATEPTAPVGGVHRYDWSFDDGIAGALASHGLRWLPIVDYSPAWVQSVPGQDHSPPSSDADYAAYAQALAARYGPNGSFWREHPDLPALPVSAFEIWNEPDNSLFWVPHPDPARYAGLYAAARAAIHAVDPIATVLIGGLAYGQSFLPSMVASDPGLQIDGVAIHAYRTNPLAIVQVVAGMRQTLNALDLQAVPLYVTEFGWTTSPPGALDYLREQLRPRYVELTLPALAACDVAATILYTWFSPGQDPRNSQQWFGISASPPDVAAFAAGVRLAARTQPMRCG